MSNYELVSAEPLVIRKTADAPTTMPAMLEYWDEQLRGVTVQTTAGFDFSGAPDAGLPWKHLLFQGEGGASYRCAIDLANNRLGDAEEYVNFPWQWGHPEIIGADVGDAHPRFSFGNK